MSTKRRVQVVLEPDVHDELKAFAEALPGGTVSGLINDTMRGFIPHFQKVREALATDNDERINQALREMLTDTINHGVRTLGGVNSTKEDDV